MEAEDLVGKRVGRFAVRERIGEGGMGVVYRAHDPRLHRDVALKVLPSQYADNDERRARFLREARSAAGLSHRNIATIYDVAVDGETPWIAMELVRGMTLEQRLTAGPLPLDEVQRVAAAVADALQVAHAAGVVHRDLKPANVMLTEDGVVKVLDFGLATPNPSSENVELTETDPGEDGAGKTAGTPAYMAPEQISGKRVDERTDLFSFGVMLYELLASERPFSGETVAQQLASTLTAPAVPITELRPDVPPALAKLVHRMLEKTPQRRPGSASDVLEVVRASVTPSRVPRRRLAVALLGVFALSVLGATAYFLLSERLPPSLAHVPDVSDDPEVQRQWLQAVESWYALNDEGAQRTLQLIRPRVDHPLPLVLLAALGGDPAAGLGEDELRARARERAEERADAAAAVSGLLGAKLRTEADWDAFREGVAALRAEYPDAYVEHLLALQMLSHGWPEEAAGIANELEVRDPAPLRPYYLQATYYARAGRHAQADDAARRGLVRHPTSAPLRRAQAGALLLARRFAAARDRFADVVAHDGTDAAARAGLAKAAFYLGDDAGWREQNRALLGGTMDPKSVVNVAIEHGKLLAARGRLDEATDLLDRAITQTRTASRAGLLSRLYLWRGLLHFRLESWEGVRAAHDSLVLLGDADDAATADDARVFAYSLKSLLDVTTAPLDDAEQTLRETERRAEAGKFPMLALMSHRLRLASRRGQVDDALALAKQLADVQREQARGENVFLRALNAWTRSEAYRAAGRDEDRRRELTALRGEQVACVGELEPHTQLCRVYVARGIVALAELARARGEVDLLPRLRKEYDALWPAPDATLPLARRAVEVFEP